MCELWIHFGNDKTNNKTIKNFGPIYYSLILLDPPGQDRDGDFHWYRLDSDGKWSHKTGEAAVTRVDNAHNEITDPRSAAMGGYHFVSFMKSNRFTVQIEDGYVCDHWPQP